MQSFASQSRMTHSFQSVHDTDLQSVEEEGDMSEYEEFHSSQNPFSKSMVSLHNGELDEEYEELDYYEEIIPEESDFVYDAAATPPTPSTPSFAGTPRPGSSSSRRSADEGVDPISEMIETISSDPLDFEDIGGLAGLTDTQVAARKLLKTRILHRTSKGESQGPIHFDHMGMLLRSFDDLVLEYGERAQQEMKGPEFWERFERIEESVAKVEQLDEAEQQIKEQINTTERTLKAKLSSLQDEEEAVATALEALGDDVPEQAFFSAFPQMKVQILRREYAKYKLPSVIPDAGKGTDLARAEVRVGSPLQSAAPAKRTMNNEEIRRQRAAEREGAPLPAAPRAESSLAADVIHFQGPVFKSSGAHKHADSDRDSAADCVPKVRFSPLGAPVVPVGAQYRRTDKDPGHKREVAPDPPEVPTRAGLLRAWKAAGQKRTWKGQAVAARAAYIAKYTQKPPENVPPAPRPPGSFPAPPLPGEPLPACQLRVRGLPMKCVEEDVVGFFGGHAEEIQDKNKDGFKGGVKIFQKDGWLTGEAIVKFQTKRAAMDALLRFDRERLGDRVIHLAYFMETIPEPRGRLLVSGLQRRTSEKDLREHFSGWHLAPAEDGHDPELLQNEEGWPTGAAVIIFVDIAAADNALLNFNFEKKIHGRALQVQVIPPLEYDEISEEWIEGPEMAESTQQILAELDENVLGRHL